MTTLLSEPDYVHVKAYFDINTTQRFLETHTQHIADHFGVSIVAKIAEDPPSDENPPSMVLLLRIKIIGRNEFDIPDFEYITEEEFVDTSEKYSFRVEPKQKTKGGGIYLCQLC